MACLLPFRTGPVGVIFVEGMRDAKTLNCYAGSLPNPLYNRVM